MDFVELVNALAEKVGLAEGIEIDSDNRCLMEFDGMIVALQGLDEVGQVSFFSSVGEPPPERLERLYRSLLEANHLFRGTSGSTLSVDPETGEMFLCRAMPYAALDGDSFIEELEKFVNIVENWRKFVADYRASPPEETRTGDEVTDLSGDNSFLRV